MKNPLYYSALLFVLAFSCTSPVDWIANDDHTPPEPVSNIEVENIHGGAKISYTLPPGNDLMGAKVAYRLMEGGEVMEKYASTGNNVIELEGFGSTDESEITVYAVDLNGNVSSGVSAVIKPLTPPIGLMRESLVVDPTFGGIRVTWDNEYEKEMGLALFVVDSTSGELMLYDNQFYQNKAGSAVFRGFSPNLQQFRIEMFDRWDNRAEGLDVEVTPLAERRLPGRQGSQHIWTLFDDDRWTYRGEIHNDINESRYANRVFSLVHDGILQTNKDGEYWNPGDDGVSIEKYVPGAGSSLIPFPNYFTVDMGRPAIYSRFNIKPRLRTPEFSAVLPVDFEIWGTNSPKLTTQVGDGSREANLAYWTSWGVVNGTDAWKNDGWVKIATCKLRLSSGESKYYSGVPLTDADIQTYRVTGYDFDINEDVSEGYRYLRWVINDTNTGQKALQISEIEFWGTYTDE